MVVEFKRRSQTSGYKTRLWNLSSHPESPEFDRCRVLFAGQQHTVGLQVTVNNVVGMAVPYCVQNLSQIVTEIKQKPLIFLMNG